MISQGFTADDADTEILRSYPWGFDQETALAILLRVRTWTLTDCAVKWSAYDLSGPNDVVANASWTDGDFGWINEGTGHDLTKESVLLRGGSSNDSNVDASTLHAFDSLTFFVSTTDEHAHVTGAAASLYINGLGAVHRPPAFYDPDTDLYHPLIIVNGFIAIDTFLRATIGIEGFSFRSFSSDAPSLPAIGGVSYGGGGSEIGKVGSIDVVIGGTTIAQPLAVLINFGGDTFLDYDMSGSTFSGQIIATDFWPYSTSNGDPVYDSDTGEILNDPFS